MNIFLEVGLLVLITVVISSVLGLLHKRILSRLQLPLHCLVWIISVSIISQLLVHEFQLTAILPTIIAIRKLAILLISAWLLMRAVDFLKIKILAQIVIIILTVIVGLQLFGIPISGLLAVGGMGGLVAGWAAKDMLANFFGGLMIHLDRPFAVGDWIRSPDKNIEGTVEDIGWRLTRIRTFDRRPLFVPNSLFSTISIENAARMTNRRIKTTINLRYDDTTKIVALLQDIENMLKIHPEIDQELPVRVRFVECAAWSLNYMLSAFTKTTNYDEFLAVQQDVFVKMLEIIAKHKAECAFPTSTIHIPGGINGTTPTHS